MAKIERLSKDRLSVSLADVIGDVLSGVPAIFPKPSESEIGRLKELDAAYFRGRDLGAFQEWMEKCQRVISNLDVSANSVLQRLVELQAAEFSDRRGGWSMSAGETYLSLSTAALAPVLKYEVVDQVIDALVEKSKPAELDSIERLESDIKRGLAGASYQERSETGAAFLISPLQVQDRAEIVLGVAEKRWVSHSLSAELLVGKTSTGQFLIAELKQDWDEARDVLQNAHGARIVIREPTLDLDHDDLTPRRLTDHVPTPDRTIEDAQERMARWMEVSSLLPEEQEALRSVLAGRRGKVIELRDRVGATLKPPSVERSLEVLGGTLDTLTPSEKPQAWAAIEEVIQADFDKALEAVADPAKRAPLARERRDQQWEGAKQANGALRAAQEELAEQVVEEFGGLVSTTALRKVTLEKFFEWVDGGRSIVVTVQGEEGALGVLRPLGRGTPPKNAISPRSLLRRARAYFDAAVVGESIVLAPRAAGDRPLFAVEGPTEACHAYAEFAPDRYRLGD